MDNKSAYYKESSQNKCVNMLFIFVIGDRSDFNCDMNHGQRQQEQINFWDYIFNWRKWTVTSHKTPYQDSYPNCVNEPQSIFSLSLDSKISFKEEYIELLKKFEVEYDEKYLFKWVDVE